MSKWICIFAYDRLTTDGEGRLLLFASEEAALAAGLAEWGEDCKRYLAAQECVDA